MRKQRKYENVLLNRNPQRKVGECNVERIKILFNSRSTEKGSNGKCPIKKYKF